ncbi:MAG: AbrB/MazE/SpoVT family DNA-binding domain-containing protein [Candidatus Kerfeldbacteria bacterium]|nr:AbrB/MazE/SpoVT family DNA-binding domain-containing protein [Candidatus Kerfeldbacteria bacterium]
MIKTMQVTSLSSKGQVVIPATVRQALNISSGSKLLIFSDGGNILLKPIMAPKAKEFDTLIQESRKIAKKTKLNKKDITKTIKNIRHARSS